MVDRFRAAQQINPACGCYYDHVYWITFAGMATTDDPRYVIGVMMDNPATNADGAAGPLGAMRWITSGLAVSFDEEFRSTVAAAIASFHPVITSESRGGRRRAHVAGCAAR